MPELMLSYNPEIGIEKLPVFEPSRDEVNVPSIIAAFNPTTRRAFGRSLGLTRVFYYIKFKSTC